MVTGRRPTDRHCHQATAAVVNQLLTRRGRPFATPTGSEFPANIVSPDNTTSGEWMIPQIDRAYRTGEMPPLLPAAGLTGQRSTGPIPLPPA